MRYLAVFISLLFLVLALAGAGLSSDQTTTAQSAVASPSAVANETERVYPIAPGVWYPGQPMPEKPMRYYRVRCWPGCHSGSDYGKYPSKSLNMKPIHQTSALRAH
ncbi:MAG: hypothetical protein PVF26_04445 [Desulfobacterales bacterium]|jgi:hypothetical protein